MLSWESRHWRTGNERLCTTLKHAFTSGHKRLWRMNGNSARLSMLDPLPHRRCGGKRDQMAFRY